jgi:hypothetical protein
VHLLIHSMVAEKCAFCVCTLGVGELLKSGSCISCGIVFGYDFHKQLIHFPPFATHKLVHSFFLCFSLSLNRFGWERVTLLAA